jgi:hypothetical protein
MVKERMRIFGEAGVLRSIPCTMCKLVADLLTLFEAVNEFRG